MSICIQNGRMAKVQYSDNFVLSVRLKGGDAMRFWTIFDRALTRNYEADRSNIVRELLGLDPLFFITQADAEYFRTGKPQSNQVPELTKEEIERDYGLNPGEVIEFKNGENNSLSETTHTEKKATEQTRKVKTIDVSGKLSNERLPNKKAKKG